MRCIIENKWTVSTVNLVVIGDAGREATVGAVGQNIPRFRVAVGTGKSGLYSRTLQSLWEQAVLLQLCHLHSLEEGLKFGTV